MKVHLSPRVLFFVVLLSATAIAWWNRRRRRRAEKIAPHHLQTQLCGKNPPQVLDVRNPDEFSGQQGHIPGAILMPLPEIEERLTELSAHRTRPLVVV
ncbi:MAG TPA: rhodanese-like domain-containing protein [Candidatus Binatia bacterium]|jgi:rhodanese-related sulfurtransferase|nr:rhodanese-like domain-containing protein [Candidatus Binatia bacterium]